MIDSFDQNAQDVGLSIDAIEAELRNGLALHSDRLVDAFVCQEFYAGRSNTWLALRESEDWIDFVKRPKRTSKLTRTVIRKLADNLYSPGPTRRLEGDATVDTWLQDVYKRNHINSLMKEADRRATLNGTAAIQVYCTGRPEQPVKLYLWGAHEFTVWGWPDDQSEPWAVATLSKEREIQGGFLMERLTATVWTRDEHRVYRGAWLQAPDAYSSSYAQSCYRYLFGRELVYQSTLSGSPGGSGINPYGCLPFSFVHAEPPISDFWEGAIGPALRDCNAEIDRELSDLAQHSSDAMTGDRFLVDVTESFRREKVPGRWQHLKGRKSDDGVEPKALIVQPQLNTELIWLNINNYANMVLEELEVPLVAVHSDAATDLSGIAIVAKHLPLLDRARSRQPDFAVAETDLAAVILTAAGNYYAGDPAGGPTFAGALLDAGGAPELSLLWPEPRMPLPTPERDLQDKFELDEGIKSLVEVVAERDGSTHDEAKDHIERVIKDNQWLASIMPRPPAAALPPPVAPADPNAPPADPQAGDNPSSEDSDGP